MEHRFEWYWIPSLDRLAKLLTTVEQNMQVLNPYLNFSGNCAEAFDFYRSVFGGEFQTRMLFKDVPSDVPVDPAEGDRMMHVCLPVGDSLLMGSDCPAQYGPVDFGNSVSISITAFSEEEADRLFNGLSAGGDATFPMSKQFWGDYFGMLKDKFGINWMISYSYQ